jgi:hypothetical protein
VCNLHIPSQRTSSFPRAHRDTPGSLCTETTPLRSLLQPSKFLTTGICFVPTTCVPGKCQVAWMKVLLYWKGKGRERNDVGRHSASVPHDCHRNLTSLWRWWGLFNGDLPELLRRAGSWLQVFGLSWDCVCLWLGLNLLGCGETQGSQTQVGSFLL